MKKFYLGILIMSASTIQSQKFPALKAPIAEKQEHIREIHGDKVNDPYYWMIDYFKKGKDSTKVVDYLKAENNYLEVMIKYT
jgi:oligopeptidase B